MVNLSSAVLVVWLSDVLVIKASNTGSADSGKGGMKKVLSNSSLNRYCVVFVSCRVVLCCVMVCVCCVVLCDLVSYCLVIVLSCRVIVLSCLMIVVSCLVIFSVL